MKEMTGTTINFLLDKLTLSKMAYNLDILSDIQTGNISNDCLGCHINHAGSHMRTRKMTEVYYNEISYIYLPGLVECLMIITLTHS